MTFSVDSYLEYFLTLLGWLLNNGVFALFVGTGLWLLPLIGMIFKIWRDVAKQGDDEGEKGGFINPLAHNRTPSSNAYRCFDISPSYPGIIE